MHELDIRRALDRAARARAILEDDLVVEALARLEMRLHGDWAGSAAGDHDGREQAYRRLRALQDFKAEFARLLSDGQVAERDLAALDRGRE